MDDCILDAQHFGTPQTRLRVYLIGRKGNHPPISFPQTKVNMNIESILDPPEPNDDPNRLPLGIKKGKEGQEIDYTRKVRTEIQRLDKIKADRT